MTGPARSIAIIGDGKMGLSIRDLALAKGWRIAALIGARESAGGSGITSNTLGDAQVAVEFTEPKAAIANIVATLRAGVPVVVGTTGWYQSLPEVTRAANESGTALLWSANFSLGVNLLLEIARYTGTLMRTLNEFDAHIVETHHSKKKDAPSGTGIVLAKAVSDGLDRPVPITSVRTGSVPGTHELIFDAAFEQLSLTHVARDRRVFAEGALAAAGWLIGKAGVFTMRDVLTLPSR
ncbi:MAG: dihydrodipicolinate reductase C-terminal domain-containing protein [Gemmatimonadaceae bacterium]